MIQAVRCFLFAAASAAVFCLAASAQQPGPSINMVSGTEWPGGDPFLQRQNEPSVAVSSRNPLHLLAGANDYRTVDLPGLPEGVTGDGWLGIFKSLDGGQTWKSTLMPGYPQDMSNEGIATGFNSNGNHFVAAADPTVRAAANGLFYYSGIVFNRGNNALGKLFVARFIDNNDESADPIQYIDTKVVASGTASLFIDKPSLAVDIPRAGAAKVTIKGQTFAVGNVYLSYTVLQGSDPATMQTTIYIMRSTDGGATWSQPSKVSQQIAISQGTVITVDPSSGTVYLAWRVVKKVSNGVVTQPDGIVVARSVDMGRSFSFANAVQIKPFEQGTTAASFRTTMYPAIAVDGTGRVYLAWSQVDSWTSGGLPGTARILMATSTNGRTWTTPVMVSPSSAPGHQLMPAMTFSGGKLMIVYYDLREDSTIGQYTPIAGTGGLYTETRLAVGDLAGAQPQPQNVFNQYIADASFDPQHPISRRHTIDVRVTQADPGAIPAFGPSIRVSNYDFGSLPGSTDLEQLQFNVPNLPMFMAGTLPFIGDYIDVAARTIIPGASGGWTYNTAPSSSETFHAVWTDNRNVFPPADGNWMNYTPVNFSSRPQTSRITLGQALPTCVEGQTGMRNQDIYTSSISQGLMVGALANSKQLGTTMQRSFVVFAQNTLDVQKSYRLAILNQPAGGAASFQQFASQTSVDVTIAPQSSVTRTVFVTSSNAAAQVTVGVAEITAPGGTIVSGGISSNVTLNSDATNPANSAIANREIYTPQIANPQIANPQIANPQIANPQIANPQIANPQIANPQIANPQIANPQIANPQIANPQIANPQIANPQIANGSMTDTTWTITNTGNTAAGYFVKLIRSSSPPAGFTFQLMITRLYQTPQAVGCDLAVQTQNQLIANIVDPDFITDPSQLVTTAADTTRSDVKNATVFLGPGESAQITLRVTGPNKAAVLDYLQGAVKPAVAAQAVNTSDLPSQTPKSSVAALDVATPPMLPAGVMGASYSAALLGVGGSLPYSWSISAGTLPQELSLDGPTGIISGIPTAIGTRVFTVRVTDAASHQATRTMTIQISALVRSIPRLAFTVQPSSTPPGQAIAPAIKVSALDGVSAPIQGALVTLAIASNPGNGILTGIATVPTDSSGIATFSNLSINNAGTGYTLTASASGATPATSNPFNVVAAGPSTLTFIVQPSNSTAGQQISPAVQVQALDASNAVVPGATITMSIGSKPCSSAVLSGDLTAVTDSLGIATFVNLILSNGGYQYSLAAFLPGAGAWSSSSFNVQGFCGVSSGMLAARKMHQSTLLPNGKVLISGGVDPILGTVRK